MIQPSPLPTALTAHPDHAVVWHDNHLYLLDQRVLPHTSAFVVCDSVAATATAIRDMVVRGAPAIGVTAAYGVVLAARARFHSAGLQWREQIADDLALLAAARPTAINLYWAVERMRTFIATLDQLDPLPALLAEAQRIHAEDIAANRTLGALGAALITAPTSVITHCNAGALATGGYGTALGVIRSAHAAGNIQRVYADETRPWLQGARLTAWELQHAGIPVTLQADVAAASLMATGEIGWVIVGADRVTANGDVCNKIGTYGLAVLARHHGVKFLVAAPTSTLDLTLASGRDIPIEERSADEVLCCSGQRVAPAGVAAHNPVFDVTPAELVDYLVTERGVIARPNTEQLMGLGGK